MLRIFHFAQQGDTSGYFPQLARWHDRSHYRMYFGTLNPIDPALREFMKSQGVRCFSCDCRSRATYPLGLLRLAAFLARQRIDILHTHLFEPSVIGLAAGVLASTPLRVMTRHYSDYHTRIQKHWHIRLDQLCTRLSHAVIAVSRHTAEHMIDTEGAPQAKVNAVLNGIDFNRLRLSSPDPRSQVRRELGVDDDCHLVLVAARLHPEKGYPQLFDAIARLRQQSRSRLLVLVAGTGPLQNEYRARIEALGCGDMVRFLGFRSDLPDLMAAADLFVLPSVAEAFGLVLAEALYLGTPVVATRVGGIPEIIDDGVDGILVPPADSAALAKAIAELLDDAPRRKRMAGAGRDRIRQRFSFEDMVRTYERLYERHLHGAGRPVYA